MEEYILKIIERNPPFFINNRITGTCAKEIASHMTKFIKWKDKNVGIPNKKGLYVYWEDHYTLETLYQYWEKNIHKTKSEKAPKHPTSWRDFTMTDKETDLPSESKQDKEPVRKHCPTCKFDFENSGIKHEKCMTCGEHFKYWQSIEQDKEKPDLNNIVFGPGDDNYGRDIPPWKKII